MLAVSEQPDQRAALASEQRLLANGEHALLSYSQTASRAPGCSMSASRPLCPPAAHHREQARPQSCSPQAQAVSTLVLTSPPTSPLELNPRAWLRRPHSLASASYAYSYLTPFHCLSVRSNIAESHLVISQPSYSDLTNDLVLNN